MPMAVLQGRVPYLSELLKQKESVSHGSISFSDQEGLQKRLESIVDWFRRNTVPSRLMEEDDTDYEKDKTHFRLLHKPRDDLPDHVQSPVFFVIVRNAAFYTFAAVLTWLHTGEIEYCRRMGGKTASTRSVKRAAKRKKGCIPFASPKAVYKLAFRLGLDDLCASALMAYRATLTRENALREFFSESASCYPELSKAAESVLLGR